MAGHRSASGWPAEVPPVLQGPYARQRQRSLTVVNNDGVYGDDNDLISGQHIGVSQVPLQEVALMVEACRTAAAAALSRAVRPLAVLTAMTGAARWLNNRIRRSRYANGRHQAWLRFRLS